MRNAPCTASLREIPTAFLGGGGHRGKGASQLPMLSPTSSKVRSRIRRRGGSALSFRSRSKETPLTSAPRQTRAPRLAPPPPDFSSASRRIRGAEVVGTRHYTRGCSVGLALATELGDPPQRTARLTFSGFSLAASGLENAELPALFPLFQAFARARRESGGSERQRKGKRAAARTPQRGSRSSSRPAEKAR